MSLYNMIFGVNPAAGILLGILGHTPETFGRFRDIYVTEMNDEIVIAVYTRNGGGNREHYDFDDMPEAGPECDCTGCTITYAIPALDGYISDEDDSFDSTYCTIYMRPPEEYRELLASAVSETTPDDDWQEFIAALNDPLEIPETRPQKLAAQLLGHVSKE